MPLRPFGLLLSNNWLSNIYILSVPDEGYSRNAPCALILDINVIIVYNNNKGIDHFLTEDRFIVRTIFFNLQRAYREKGVLMQ